jgi:hypothetical protein
LAGLTPPLQDGWGMYKGGSMGVLSAEIVEKLNKEYADTYKDRTVLAKAKGRMLEFNAGYFLKKFGSVVVLRKKNGKRVAFV